MRRALFAILPAAAVLAAMGPAPSVAPPPQAAARERVCFLPQAVANYRTVDDTTVYVRDLRGQVFEIQTSGCRGLSHSRSFAISPAMGSSACTGESVTVATQGPSLRGENNSVCRARVTRRLDAAEVAALPKGARP